MKFEETVIKKLDEQAAMLGETRDLTRDHAVHLKQLIGANGTGGRCAEHWKITNMLVAKANWAGGGIAMVGILYGAYRLYQAFV